VLSALPDAWPNSKIIGLSACGGYHVDIEWKDVDAITDRKPRFLTKGRFMAKKWYYAEQGQQQGPVSEEELKKRLRSGQLEPTDLVWSRGMAEWTPALDIEAFTSILEDESPPPLPPSPTRPVQESGKTSTSIHDEPVGQDDENLNDSPARAPATLESDLETIHQLSLAGRKLADCIRGVSTGRIDQWKEAARNGHPIGQWLAGECNASGLQMPEDQGQAAQWFAKSAEQGFAFAQYSLARCYGKGQGVDANREKCGEWLREAAEQKLAIAQNLLGYCLERGMLGKEDLPAAVRCYREAAEQRCAAAQYNLGRCYQYGIGIVEHLAESATWFRRAAEQGYALAQTELAVCYHRGIGLNRDASEATRWHRAAAIQGDARSQVFLRTRYRDGEWFPMDLDEASELLSEAAEKGRGAARYMLDLVRQRGLPPPIKPEGTSDRDRASGDGNPAPPADSPLQGLHQTAEEGDASAQNELGDCYFDGTSVPPDHSKAVYWYRRAAEQGHVEAERNLGCCLIHGQGVPQNATQGVRWLHRAAQRGDAAAQQSLCVCYVEGIGVSVDGKVAMEWLAKSAAQGFEPAITALERLKGMYAEAAAVEQDEARQVPCPSCGELVWDVSVRKCPHCGE